MKTFEEFSEALSLVGNRDASAMMCEPEADEAKRNVQLEREKAYTNLANAYVENYKDTHNQKRKLKCCFFWIIMSTYLLIIVGAVAAIILSLVLKAESLLAVFIGSAATIISSMIIIPTIIAQYLFSKNEDGNITDTVKAMFAYDSKSQELAADIRKTNEKIGAVKEATVGTGLGTKK